MVVYIQIPVDVKFKNKYLTFLGTPKVFLKGKAYKVLQFTPMNNQKE